MGAIEESRASKSAKLCFRFVVLTACRSGEARLATWDEIDREAEVWTVPSNRMNAAREHRVPLSGLALCVVDAAAATADGSGLLFPSPVRQGRPLSYMRLTKLLRSSGLAERATLHGFRSSFRIWAAERTSVSHAAMELALAHTVGSAVEQAYLRSDLLEQRRTLMHEWAPFGDRQEFGRSRSYCLARTFAGVNPSFPSTESAPSCPFLVAQQIYRFYPFAGPAISCVHAVRIGRVRSLGVFLVKKVEGSHFP